MGDYITEKFLNIGSYGIAGAGIVTNWENTKATILFVLGVVLLITQITLHIIKIVKEKKNDK